MEYGQGYTSVFLALHVYYEVMMSRKKPNTPRSRVKNAIRLLWMRSRERAAALKKHDYRCVDCGIKQSMAKDKEVKIEVHHEPQIDWTGIVQLIFDRILNVPQYPLCKDCHKKKHETTCKDIS